ncbi:MAG: hypothetical protein ACOCVM_08555 [Desulfovibrionaceae bacterium]
MQRIIIKKNLAFPVIVTLAVFAAVFAALAGQNPPWGVWALVVLAPAVLIFWMIANRHVGLDPQARRATLPFMLFFRTQTPWEGIDKKLGEEVIEDHGHEKTVHTLTVSGPFPEASTVLDSEEERQEWAALDDVETPAGEEQEQEAA